MILCIIPARSGSKRLPGKNLRPFCGKPLLQWSVEQALRINEIDRVVLTTDYSYADLGYEHDKHGIWAMTSIIERPSYLCRDDAPMAHVLCHTLSDFLTWPSLVVLLQPTSPTRTDETVRKAISMALPLNPWDTRGGAASSADGCGPDGAVYAFTPNRLPPLNDCIYFGNDDIDINTLEDFEKAEAVMKARLK